MVRPEVLPVVHSFGKRIENYSVRATRLGLIRPGYVAGSLVIR